MLLLIHNYLSTRRARIKLGKKRSESFDCRIGIPQGGVLSPLIFLIFISDILEPTKIVTVYKYANNTSFLVTEDDAEASLHTAIVKISEVKYWCFRNCIKLNETKTAFLAIIFTPDEKQRI